jgi:hypothetical protein
MKANRWMADMRWMVTALLLALAALLVLSLTSNLMRNLPDSALVAKYVGKGKVAPEAARVVRNPWLPVAGCLWLTTEPEQSHSTAEPPARSYLATGERDDVACSEFEGISSSVMHWPDVARVAGTTLAYRREPLDISSNEQGKHSQMVSRHGQTVPQGASLTLTLKPDVQNAAQAQAECLTGNALVCQQLGISMKHWAVHYEGAGARMTGVVVMDVTTGQVEAFAGAHSRCFAADHSSDTPRASDCPAMPFAPAKRDYRLGTHAASQAMPASLDKPLLALAGLADERLRDKLMGAGKAEFLQALGHSNSPYFLDMVFCRDLGYINCGRMTKVREAASKLGWNQDCDRASAGNVPPKCGLFNLLYDPENPPLGNFANLGSYVVLGGRIMPAHTGREAYNASMATKCAQQSKPWESCRQGGEFINLMSEAYGQGHALATPVGVAQLYANLANSANAVILKTSPTLVQAHLVQGGTARSGAPNQVQPQNAALVLEGLTGTHQAGGTAYSACLRANEGKKEPAEKLCKHNRWSSKTGTPSFAHKDLSLPQRAALCREASLKPSAPAVQAIRSSCAMLPYKWFVSVVKNSRGLNSKVIAVLAERNWRKDTGLVDSPYDRGSPNVAAELGIRLVQQLEQQGAI